MDTDLLDSLLDNIKDTVYSLRRESKRIFNNRIVKALDNSSDEEIKREIENIYRRTLLKNFHKVFEVIESRMPGYNERFLNFLGSKIYLKNTPFSGINEKLIFKLFEYKESEKFSSDDIIDRLMTLKILETLTCEDESKIRMKILEEHLEGKLETEFIELIDKEFFENNGINTLPYKIKGSKDTKVGIELEVADIDVGKASKLLKTNDLEGFKVYIDHTIRQYNKDEDRGDIFFTGSHYGDKTFKLPTAEIVNATPFSPNNEDEIKNIFQMMDLLRKNGAKVNYSCGFHIHVSRPELDDISSDKIKELAEDFSKIQETLFVHFNAFPSRTWIHARQVHMKEKDDDEEITEEQIIRANDGMLETPSLEYCENNPYTSLNKKTALNFYSLEQGKGIEYRFFNLPDELSPASALAMIDFAVSYTDYVVSNGMISKELEALGIEDEDEKFKYIITKIGMAEESIEFLENYNIVCNHYSMVDKRPFRNSKHDFSINYYDEKMNNEEYAFEKILMTQEDDETLEGDELDY